MNIKIIKRKGWSIVQKLHVGCDAATTHLKKVFWFFRRIPERNSGAFFLHISHWSIHIHSQNDIMYISKNVFRRAAGGGNSIEFARPGEGGSLVLILIHTKNHETQRTTTKGCACVWGCIYFDSRAVGNSIELAQEKGVYSVTQEPRDQTNNDEGCVCHRYGVYILKPPQHTPYIQERFRGVSYLPYPFCCRRVFLGAGNNKKQWYRHRSGVRSRRYFVGI